MLVYLWNPTNQNTIYSAQMPSTCFMNKCDFKMMIIILSTNFLSFLQVKTVNHPTTKFTVPKLEEGRSYMFRVVAENVNGDSEALETETPVKAENPFSKCKQRMSNWTYRNGKVATVALNSSLNSNSQ